MTEMRARLVDKDGNPLGTASNPLKISGDVGGGVPDGGTTGQVLQKKSDADQDVEWGDGSGSSTAWGSITGTLSDQTDLGNVLDGKIAATDVTYENLNANGDVGTTSGTVCAGDDSRLSDSRTPTSHGNEAHSATYIEASGVTYENLSANGDVGTTTGTVCAGDDSRLSDSRTPTSHGNEAHSSTFLTEIAWGDITGTLSDQTDLGTVLDGKASKTDSDLTLYVYEDATGDGDGSSKANGFTTLQAAIDAIPDVAQNVTIIVCKGSTNYLGQTTTIQKASVKSLAIRGEFYAYEACDTNAVAGKIVDASADFSNFEVGDRVVCTKYSGTVGASAIVDYFYATITEVGEGYVQTSEETKVPTTGWRYLINQTVFDGDGGAGLFFAAVAGGVLGIGFQNHVNGINCGSSSNVTINSCIFDASVPSVVSYQDCKAYLRNSAVINIPSAMSGVYVDSGAYLLIKNTVFGAASLTTTTGIRLGPGCIGGNIEYCGFYGFNRGITNQNPVCNVSIVYAYFDSVCNAGASGYNITLVSCTNNAATPVYHLTSGGSIEKWNGQALPSIDDATGGQVLALKSDKSALEFASKQPLDATLTALAGLTTAANKLPYATGEDTFDVCDFTPLGRSLIGTTTASAVRDLIASASSTTVTQSIYVDKAATGNGTGVDWTNAFTTIQAAVDSLPAIINHAVTIIIRKGSTPYNENITIRRVVAAGSITIRGEYYWYGTVAASKTGKITLGVSDYGYADRAQIAAGDVIWATKWSGDVGVSIPLESIIDTVSSVSGAEVSLTTNAGKTIDTSWSYEIVKTRITGANYWDSGTMVLYCPCSISGLYIDGTGNGACISANFSAIVVSVAYCYLCGSSSKGYYGASMGSTLTRSCINLTGTGNGVHISFGNFALDRCVINAPVGVRAGSSFSPWSTYNHIMPGTGTGIWAIGNAYVRFYTGRNDATTPKNPATTVEGAYILIG